MWILLDSHLHVCFITYAHEKFASYVRAYFYFVGGRGRVFKALCNYLLKSDNLLPIMCEYINKL